MHSDPSAPRPPSPPPSLEHCVVRLTSSDGLILCPVILIAASWLLVCVPAWRGLPFSTSHGCALHVCAPRARAARVASAPEGPSWRTGFGGSPGIWTAPSCCSWPLGSAAVSRSRSVRGACGPMGVYSHMFSHNYQSIPFC